MNEILKNLSEADKATALEIIETINTGKHRAQYPKDAYNELHKLGVLEEVAPKLQGTGGEWIRENLKFNLGRWW